MSARTWTGQDAPVTVESKSVTNATLSPKAKISPTKVPHMSRKDVTVSLQYLKNDPLYETTKPLQIVPEWRDDEGRTNIRLEAGPLETLTDVRGAEDDFTLDKNGFCYVHAPTKFQKWDSQPAIGKEYLAELENLLKREVEGCDEVLFYDARLRQETETGIKVQGLSYKPFARQVHTDNTESSVLTKIRNLTEMKAEYHLSGRVRIINIWRPIKHPVYDCGLAIADGAELRDGDVLECDRVRRDTGEFWDTMGVVRYRPGFHWYYKSHQEEADVLLFKNYDTAVDVPARWCLHTAFDLPPEDVPADAPTRESIEVRALVFTHPDGICRSSGPSLLTQHPLAISLAEGGLKHVDDEDSITDRLRTDIDEGNEVKDAVLLLRRREIQRLESVRDTLLTQSDRLQRELDGTRLELRRAHEQIEIQGAEVAKLERKVRALEKGPDWHDVQKWKGEAMGRSHEAIDRTWQGSGDEAVRREREKDSVVISNLTQEVEALKVQLQAQKAEA